MAKSTLGNNAQPVCFLTEYEVEVDDDEYENMDGELVDEQDIFGYRATCPKNSDSTTVTIYFYYHAPTSYWYWEQAYGLAYKPIIPVVFACDSNWKLTQCLNQNFYEIDLTNRSDGWISMNVTLTRKLVKNERIVFGVYSDILGVSSSSPEWNLQENTQCYYYYSLARRRDYNTAIAYISSSAFIQKADCGYSDWEVCLYLEYENEVESVAYTRTVLGNVRAATGNSRKMIWKRTLRPGGNLTSTLNRRTVWQRNANSSGTLASQSQRHNLLKRRNSSGFSATSENSNNVFFFRFLEGSGDLSTRVLRSNRMKIENSEDFSLSDSLQQLLLIIRSCFSSAESTESLRLKADYKRIQDSIVDDEESIIRWGESFRSFTDEVDFEARPFASRLFFRTVQTVMVLWDWLRGKIREANNVVTFYCPIWTEIEMECRI
ncbi:hypothetical protein [Treponema bryantii]|uniref:hypothetical protein n=1 Tax=Treponema bryantii TaxID=163 RepID=UPI002B320E52|nr:hypothetical protein TRBR_17360 [Treponema bryantii]